ncbi:unnamed protein product [Euphydryas editha]|uniref:HAT C-terminal dimerisation domain-containing protein n=1 Tax=Euphydryas editha TaxID=104508 RepID=A0AAU9UP41_EUPED|nr:unnamed protein product [Euphydryas editha]
MCLCHVLDPRFKLHVFKYPNFAADVKTCFIDLVTDLIKKNLPIGLPTEHIVHDEPQPKKIKFDIWGEYYAIINTVCPGGTPSSQVIVEVQRYLELPVLDRKENPLQWWKTFSHSFPNLAVLARQRLNFITTSVPSGNLINERRTSLGVNKVQQLLFLNLNYEP